ncbi:General secretion pathway protein F [Limihaloglobus sulfuriphilus]|uniref:General secretion pathway protein F n=1 Tax=Limihaloglobus sulfuriphilus TaxID=1851148 RepID=A0A1Q2MBL0_9BACT|nr:type II secretion system F family protein [Limihaloglobus sulfuriphilus]AQQ70115.1 General secretion pathway protein F [Limihaloglobus sulfuriphilus]
MPVFQYDALDANGKPVKGEIEALTSKEASSKIRNQGYFPTAVKAKGGSKKVAVSTGTRRSRPGANRKVKIKVVTQFARQLSILQDAGLSVLRSLRILQEQQKKGKFRNILGYVAEDIEAGSTLSEAMARYPRCFDNLFSNMVAAGEVGGVLDIILNRVADFMEKAEKLKARIKGAMIYPAVVLFAAMVILLGLMIFIIPTFAEVLTDMTDGGARLPGLTLALMSFSDWILNGFGFPGGGAVVILVAPFVLVFTLKFLRRFKFMRYLFDRIKLKMPIIGKLTYLVAVARWTRTLGTLISAGVPILEAINITRDTSGNEVYARMLDRVHMAIRQGDTFANPLKQSKTVDTLVVNMIDVGEETGEIDKMMYKIADNYDEQVDVLVGSLMSLLEPVMIIVLGGIVGVIVLAMFLPMVTIITSLM